ncbi:MAG: VOC family protein [Polyangiales bacterium]
MGISHIALAVKNIEETQRFYTEAMGFALVKVEIVPHRKGGFARHVFFSTGAPHDQLIAFWDFSAAPNVGELKTDISRDLGLDALTNHVAFRANDLDELDRCKQRWLAFGRDVLEVDHGWIHSIYTQDPDGITVEFAVLTRAFTEQDAVDAISLLHDDTPPAPRIPPHTIHRPGD